MLPPKAEDGADPAGIDVRRIIFGATIFLSAFLLFQVQLILAKFLLPWFGGTPSVWTACLLFFQVLLFGGYFYAHLLTGQQTRNQRILHLAIVAAALVFMLLLVMNWHSPLLPEPGLQPRSSANPVSYILLLLAWAVGLPFFVLSSTGPLLQEWYTRVSPGQSPYFLYAISNAGSLLGLLSYPVAIEPYLTTHHQADAWAVGFLLFAAAMSACAWMLRSAPQGYPGAAPSEPMGEAARQSARPSAWTQLLWFALAACGSVMLLATTNQICQDIAVVPLLWVVPLALYLLTFIIVFGRPGIYRREIFQPLFGLMAVITAVILYQISAVDIAGIIGAFSITMFAACMVLHGELVRLKPQTRYLTRFYLWISLGGAAGAIAVCVLAPRIFSGFWEVHAGLWTTGLLLVTTTYGDRNSWLHGESLNGFWGLLVFLLVLPYALSVLSFPGVRQQLGDPVLLPLLVLVAAGWIVSAIRARKERKTSRFIRMLAPVMAVLLLTGLGVSLITQIRKSGTALVTRKRNFYGVLTIFQAGAADDPWRAYILRHGETWHGSQLQNPAYRDIPTAYYTNYSGIGLLLRSHPRIQKNLPLRIGAVGMGTGTLAAYVRPGDAIRFYEINPQVLDFSADENSYFTYARDAHGKVEVVMGDARLSLQQEAKSGELQNFDVLVLDAFSGDAVPAHLLTREAFELYRKHLRDRDSVIAVHISNRALDLKPILAAVADHFGWSGMLIDNPKIGFHVFGSEWILLKQKELVLNFPAAESSRDQIRSLDPVPGFRLWTDDYSNILKILKHQSQ